MYFKKDEKMILIIDKNKKAAEMCVEMFHHMGILSYGVSPEAAFSELDLKYRAVIAVSPEGIPDLKNYMKRLRTYTVNIPIFALCRENPYGIEQLFDDVYEFDILSSKLVSSAAEYCRTHRLQFAGGYKLAGIDASSDTELVSYYGDEILLTRTEKMILRYLIRAYPTPASATDILKYAYRPGRRPMTSSVRTHISVINRKFREVTGKAPIASFDAGGYVIMTPVLKEHAKILERAKN